MHRTSFAKSPRHALRTSDLDAAHHASRCVAAAAPRDAPGSCALIGRERELASVRAAFAAGARLVTLHGPAGIGKTAAAREFLRGCDAGYAPARRVVCELTDAHDGAALAHAVSRALEVVVAAGGDDAFEAIGRALAACGPLLVVLDNFEQLVELAPRSVGRWLALAPGARFLVTTRERLRLSGERCVKLGPLAMPAVDERDPSAIAASDAVRLFVERARALDARFTLTPAASAEVAAIVRAVDGIPLAIELCAARSDVLAPAELRRALARRFELLVRGARGGTARHATLRAAIDWSWHLLAPWERDALAACAVFRGGFTLEAAARVLDPSRWIAADDPGRAPTVLDALSALIDKSLVHVEATPGEPGARRFALYESVREYAAERLACDARAADAVAARHADHYLAEGACLAARATTGPDAGAALAALARELENLRAVYDRAMAARPFCADRALVALGALVVLDPVTLARNPLGPYARMLDDALAAAPADTPPAARARALLCGAKAAWLAGRLPRSMALFAHAARAADAAGDDAQAAMALVFLGSLHREQGAAAACEACFAQAAERLARADDPWLRANHDLLRALVLADDQRFDEAEALAAGALAQFERAGTERLAAFARAQLGTFALERGRLDEACARLSDAIARARPAGDVGLEATALGYRARALQARGDFDAAHEGFARALALHERVGQARLAGLLHGHTAGLWLERAWASTDAEAGTGEDREAWLAHAGDHAARAVAALEAAGDTRHVAVFLALQAAADAARGLLADAAARLDAAVRALPPGAATASVAVTLMRGHLDCARARRARAAGDARSAARHLTNARLALAGEGADGATYVACSELVRLARRLLAHAVADAGDDGAAPDGLARELVPARRPRSANAAESCATQSPPGARGVALTIGPEARWFSTPEGGRVELLRRRAPRLILARLVEVRLTQPGRALSLDELFDAGWPGERARADSAANRVYVALTRLRQLGLRALLKSRDDGFLLDPEACVESEAAPRHGRAA